MKNRIETNRAQKAPTRKLEDSKTGGANLVPITMMMPEHHTTFINAIGKVLPRVYQQPATATLNLFLDHRAMGFTDGHLMVLGDLGCGSLAENASICDAVKKACKRLWRAETAWRRALAVAA